jgi:transposase
LFIRVTKVKRADGKIDEYIRLVESCWNQGSPTHRVICNLGRKELLAPHVDALMRILKGEEPSPKAGSASAVGAWDWGVMLVARHLSAELGLTRILDVKLSEREVTDRVLALVANRLCKPASEHGMARWLETDFVCDRFGNRWLPEWRNDEERLKSKRPRVRVKDRQLRQWYGTLDQLGAHKKEIEKELFLSLRTLFALNVDLVFYDLTSTYFEGNGPALAKHGHSRDGKPRNRQILVGVVMIDGWPIAHHVFEGNKRDSLTVQGVVKDLLQRFGLRRVVFVGDRGMMTVDNVAEMRQCKQGYVVGLNRRRRPDVLRYIERATGPWLDCRVGKTASEKSQVPQTRVQEVATDQAGVRVFVVDSDERRSYERGEREKVMERVRTSLESLQQRVEKGKLKAPEKIGAAASRLLSRHHGSRYYDWKLEDGKFHFFEHSNLKQEKAIEGKYLIQTEERDLSPTQAVETYKELSEVERAFRQLKDVIEMRPIYHQNSARVQAHVFVASLAFLLDRALEKKLQSAHLDISSTEAWQLLRTVRVVDIDLGNGERKRSVTDGSPRASQILRALCIQNRHPDTRKGDTTAA